MHPKIFKTHVPSFLPSYATVYNENHYERPNEFLLVFCATDIMYSSFIFLAAITVISNLKTFFIIITKSLSYIYNKWCVFYLLWFIVEFPFSILNIFLCALFSFFTNFSVVISVVNKSALIRFALLLTNEQFMINE